MYIDLGEYMPLPEGDHQYSIEYIENHQVIKINEDPDNVVVAAVHYDDLKLLHSLQIFHGKHISVLPIQTHHLAEYLAGRSSGSAVQAPLGEDDNKNMLDQLAHDAPIVNLVNSLLLEGIRINCSDIHIEAFEKRTLVRYRIDGVLRIGKTLEWQMFQGIAARIKVMANLNIIEKRLPQDGRLQVHSAGDTVEFRVSIVPIQEGESIVLRLFKKTQGPATLENLGFAPEYINTLRRSSRLSNGLILITGPTGSGKTTTLNAMLAEMNDPSLKIITIEDPVENVLTGINQVQTNEAIGLTFDSILQRLLRQDPDILMIGEIRDRKTAELAVRSALTGHLVLSTLHTNDALSAITRLVNMGIEPYLLAGVLRALSAQRLVRVLCPQCKTSRSPSDVEQLVLQRRLPVPSQIFHPVGCKDCSGSGYSGRMAIGEIFEISQDIEDLICRSSNRLDLVDYFKKRQIEFLIDAGFALIEKGLTSLAEIERTVVLTE